MADAEDSGQWLTLAELAAARRISKASAARLVRRHKQWRRQQDNQGRVRILVPPDAIEPRDDLQDDLQDGPEGRPPDSHADSPDTSRAISTLEAAISTLREQLAEANRRAHADAAAISEANARADRAVQGREDERARADALRDRLNAMQAQLADAHAALQRAETADARAERAERDKDRAEQGREAERVRADALRERLDDLTGKLSDTQAELAGAQDQADAAVRGLWRSWRRRRRLRIRPTPAPRQWLKGSRTLRQAEAERRARGRWARIRAAWRGE